MRWAMTRVLPPPAPARTRSGPSVWTTASCWAGFSPARISSGTRPRPSPPFTAPSPTPAATAESVLDPPPQEPLGEGQHAGRPERRAPQEDPLPTEGLPRRPLLDGVARPAPECLHERGERRRAEQSLGCGEAPAGAPDREMS